MPDHSPDTPVIRMKEAKSILSKSRLSDYSVNPYTGCTHACAYCYASYMNEYTAHQERWGTYVDVKHWPDIRRPEKYTGKSIAVGTVTDPYQPAEAQFGRTRAFLEQMKDSGAHISITTKSDLVLRDLGLLRSLPEARVLFSINTLDEQFQQDMDKAAPIAKRISAMRTLHEAGVHTTCFIAPVMPGITGVPSIILAVRQVCDEIYIDGLNLRTVNRSAIFRYIREKRPELVELYQNMYEDGDRRYWDALHRQLTKFARETGLAYIREHWGEVVSGSGPKIISFIK